MMCTCFIVAVMAAVAEVNGFASRATSVIFDTFSSQDIVIDPCYETGSGGGRKSGGSKPRSCVPDFVNAAFGVKVETTATCEPDEEEVCDEDTGKCYKCKDHPSEFLTDLHNPSNETCWQSGVLEPGENASLTVSLAKKYELTYISLHFCSKKPEHMVIYKSMDHGKTWQPFQYYSSDCLGTFSRRRDVSITRANEQEALCVGNHLDPEDTSTRIAFSTLADRPSSEDFEHSPVLQDWVTATDIRIVFPQIPDIIEEDDDDDYDEDEDEDYLGDEPFDDGDLSFFLDNKGGEDDEDEEATTTTSANYNTNNVIENRSFIPSGPGKPKKKKKSKSRRRPGNWIGISDLAIGGRCKCNGHASECSIDATGEMSCNCKHNTAGRECEKCKGKEKREKGDRRRGEGVIRLCFTLILALARPPGASF